MKKFLDINDIKICLDDSETDKKPILLIHGLSSTKEAMYMFRDALKEDYRVITIDLRGHGESSHPLEYTLEDHVKDVLEIVRELGLENIDVLGYSMGSYVALATAEENCDNIDHLILLCTNPSSKVSNVSKLLAKKGLDYSKISRNEMFKAIYDSFLSPVTLKKIANGEFNLNTTSSNYEIPELSLEEKAAEIKSISDFDNSKDYDKVTCKTLVIGAEHDQILPYELGKEVADSIDGAEFKLIKNAGHMVAYEKADELIAIIKDFLKKE
ncbi:MAG: alpha/beta hydrolase [Methanobacteriaceae archaeon]|nr:alpha/beta hydrolase [Methanobacteriaceae archaeon]